jgi:RNA polymerase sigma factor (sigma-70 family)
MLDNLLVKDVLSIVDGCNHDGHVLPVAVIKESFSDLREKAIDIYEGRGPKKSLTTEEEQRFFMAYNAARIHLFNHVSHLDPEDVAVHVSVIYEKVIEARNNLALCNNRLIHYCSGRFFKDHFDGSQKAEQHYGDVFDGLLNAVKNFNYALGWKFSTYATQSIRNLLIKVSSSYRNNASLDELGDAGFDVGSIKTDELYDDGDERKDIISDIIVSDFNDKELNFSDMDRSILKFHIDSRSTLTNEVIGKIYGVSRETIRLKKIECLKKIESYIERKLNIS